MTGRAAPRRLVWIIAGATLVRAAVAATLPLHHDEAYYWLWAHRLDWSYLDHPPMIAYLIFLTTRLGDGELWVRLSALLLGVGTAYTLFLLGREMFDERVGLLAATLFQVVPLLFLGGLAATPDAPLYLAWALALRFCWHALHGRPQRWTAAGLALGAGLLSKLYMALFGVGVGLYLALSARSWFHRKELYRALLLALLVFLPVIYWNASHDWAGLRFALHGRAPDIGRAPHGLAGIKRLLEPHLEIVLLLFPAFVWAFWAAWRRQGDERFKYLLWTSFPALVLPLLLAPLGIARGHWLGPGYLGLAVILSALWTRPVTYLAVGTAALVGGFFSLILVPAFPALPLAGDIYGWDQAATRVEQEIAALGDSHAVVVTDYYEIAGELSYYTRLKHPVLLVPPPDPAGVWPPLDTYAGASGVAVTFLHSPLAWVRCFDRAVKAPLLTEYFRGRPIASLQVFRVQGLTPPCSR